MTRTPPLLPEEALIRVLRVARVDGMGVLVVAGVFAILSATGGDRVGALIGLLVAGAGAVEVHGGTLLQHGARRGISWLIFSQFFLMVAILGYCQLRLVNPNLSFFIASLQPMEAEIKAQGQTVTEMARAMNSLTYTVLAAATVLYQGGMVLYYFRRRRSVMRALETEPEI